jgi:hypothetical protein
MTNAFGFGVCSAVWQILSTSTPSADAPYRDYETQKIVDAIMKCSPNAKIFVFGDSLDANNSPVIGLALNGHRTVDGIWGSRHHYTGRGRRLRQMCFSHVRHVTRISWRPSRRATPGAIILSRENM